MVTLNLYVPGTGTGSRTCSGTLDFVRFQEPVLDGTLNLKKDSKNGFWQPKTLNMVPELVLWNPKFVKRVPEPVPWNPKLKRVPVRQRLEPVLET
jgi:hypothetical protein